MYYCHIICQNYSRRRVSKIRPYIFFRSYFCPVIFAHFALIKTNQFQLKYDTGYVWWWQWMIYTRTEKMCSIWFSWILILPAIFSCRASKGGLACSVSIIIVSNSSVRWASKDGAEKLLLYTICSPSGIWHYRKLLSEFIEEIWGWYYQNAVNTRF